MTNYEKFVKLLLAGHAVILTTVLLASAIYLQTIDPFVLGSILLLSFVLSLIPVLIVAGIRAFIISEIDSKEIRSILMLLICLHLFGYPWIALIGGLALTYYSHTFEDLKIEIPKEEPVESRTDVYEVYEYDIIGQKYVINAEQTVLGILKEKGAPIDGTFHMKFKPGYEVIRTFDPIHRIYTFQVKKL